MARKPRIEGENLWYHFIARGIDEIPLFKNEYDNSYFLKLLNENCMIYSVEVHAYVLMKTHVHLFIKTLHPNLSRFAHRLLSSYSKYYNARYQRKGHVFIDRYKAPIVDSNVYGREVNRYIHLNPARALHIEDVESMRHITRTYPWSSYGVYIGDFPKPEFLYVKETLNDFGNTTKDAIKKYMEFVEEGLLRELPLEIQRMYEKNIIGSRKFADDIQKLKKKNDSENQSRVNIPDISIDTIIDMVAQEYGVDKSEICFKGRQHREARKVLMWILYETYSHKLTQCAVGALAGGVSGRAIYNAWSDIEYQKGKNTTINTTIQRIITKLSSMKEVTTVPGTK